MRGEGVGIYIENYTPSIEILYIYYIYAQEYISLYNTIYNTSFMGLDSDLKEIRESLKRLETRREFQATIQEMGKNQNGGDRFFIYCIKAVKLCGLKKGDKVAVTIRQIGKFETEELQLINLKKKIRETEKEMGKVDKLKSKIQQIKKDTQIKTEEPLTEAEQDFLVKFKEAEGSPTQGFILNSAKKQFGAEKVTELLKEIKKNG